MYATIFFLLAAMGQVGDSTPPPVAPRIPVETVDTDPLPTKPIPEVIPAPKLSPSAYEVASQKALDERKVLIVFINCPSRPISGAIVCESVGLPGYPTKCIVVAYPRDGEMKYGSTNHPTAIFDSERPTVYRQSVTECRT